MPNLAKLAQLKVVEESGELNLVRRKKKKERRRRKKIHFLAPKWPISNSHKIQNISYFDKGLTGAY